MRDPACFKQEVPFICHGNKTPWMNIFVLKQFKNLLAIFLEIAFNLIIKKVHVREFSKLLKFKGAIFVSELSSFPLTIYSVNMTKSSMKLRIWSHLLKAYLLVNFIFLTMLYCYFNILTTITAKRYIEILYAFFTKVSSNWRIWT